MCCHRCGNPISLKAMNTSNRCPFCDAVQPMEMQAPVAPELTADTSQFRCPECRCDVISIQAMHVGASEMTSTTNLRMIWNPTTQSMRPQPYVSQVLVNPELHQFTAPPEVPMKKEEHLGGWILAILIGSFIFPPVFVITIPFCIVMYCVNEGAVSNKDYGAVMASYQAQLNEYQKTWVCPRCMKKWLFT